MENSAVFVMKFKKQEKILSSGNENSIDCAFSRGFRSKPLHFVKFSYDGNLFFCGKRENMG